jgi:hypothetical protein
MQQIPAVKKMMLTIKLEEFIPEEYLPSIRNYLLQMYAVGYDEARTFNNYKRKQIVQYDETGKFISSFNSRKQASRQTGFPVSSIWRSMVEERPVRGYVWKYV